MSTNPKKGHETGVKVMNDPRIIDVLSSDSQSKDE